MPGETRRRSSGDFRGMRRGHVSSNTGSHDLYSDLACLYLSDLPRRDAAVGELMHNAVGKARRADHHEADAHVEDAEHFGVGDVAECLHPPEHRWDCPGTALDVDAQTRR